MIGTEPRLSITHARAGDGACSSSTGHVDLDGAPRLAEVLQRPASVTSRSRSTCATRA